MAASLQKSHAELEQKVDERTRELQATLEQLAMKSRELEDASKHKSEFLANMSHELRTPLNAIIGFSQVLQQKLFGEVNDKQEEYLEDILGSANHLLALINDVLDLSKVEAGQVELEKGRSPCARRSSAGWSWSGSARSRTGSAHARARPEVDLVEGDERRIRQVVFNLLSNAVKFTPQGGSVDVARPRRTARCSSRSPTPGPESPQRTRSASSRSSSRPTSAGAARGHRPRPCPLEEAGRAARRPDLGRVRAGQGFDLHLHPARRSSVRRARRPGPALPPVKAGLRRSENVGDFSANEFVVECGLTLEDDALALAALSSISFSPRPSRCSRSSGVATELRTWTGSYAAFAPIIPVLHLYP